MCHWIRALRWVGEFEIWVECEAGGGEGFERAYFVPCGCLGSASLRLSEGLQQVGKFSRGLLLCACQVDGMNVVREDGHTNALYVFFLISYVVIINWILLQVHSCKGIGFRPTAK